MTTFFIGVMVAGLACLATRKVRDSEGRLEHYDRIRQIEQEIQQEKDKVFFQQFWW